MTSKIAKHLLPQKSKVGLTKNLNFRRLLASFGAKIYTKVGLLKKRMVKHIINNSQTSLKKSRIQLFRNPKWPNTGANLSKSVDFGVNLWSTSSNSCLLYRKKIKTVQHDGRTQKINEKTNSHVFVEKGEKAIHRLIHTATQTPAQ